MDIICSDSWRHPIIILYLQKEWKSKQCWKLGKWLYIGLLNSHPAPPAIPTLPLQPSIPTLALQPTHSLSAPPVTQMHTQTPTGPVDSLSTEDTLSWGISGTEGVKDATSTIDGGHESKHWNVHVPEPPSSLSLEYAQSYRYTSPNKQGLGVFLLGESVS